jgi:tRNA A37 methylthiotransferase MiaB
MQRRYTIQDIIDKIDILRKEFPHLTISTDIICGFPGETEYDFFRTINFVKWLKPEIINISKFTPRPGTQAKKMKQLNSKLIKERSIRLSDVFRNTLVHINDFWKNWEGEVLVLHGGTEESQVFSRNFAYKNVLLERFDGEFGQFVDVRIKKVDGFNLFGEIHEL